LLVRLKCLTLCLLVRLTCTTLQTITLVVSTLVTISSLLFRLVQQVAKWPAGTTTVVAAHCTTSLGLGGLALGRTGASVQNIPGGEIYQSLSSGAIDGAEWIGPFADERLGFQEICEFYYTGGMHEPGSALVSATNLDVFNELTPKQQKIIETAAAATHQWSLSQSNYNNGAALERLKAQGVKVLEFGDDIWDAFGVAAAEALDDFMDDELFARIRASQEAAVNSVFDWTSVSDDVFTAQRGRVRAG